jgi:hypothetical protein
VQYHRIGGDQFLPLEAIDQVSRRLGVIETGELLGELIEPFDGAGVVVGVVAGEIFSDKPLIFVGSNGIGLASKIIGLGAPGAGPAVCAAAGVTAAARAAPAASATPA